MINVKDVHDAAVLINSVHNAIGAAARGVTAVKRSIERFADPVRVSR